jgi:hypothetical protein
LHAISHLRGWPEAPRNPLKNQPSTNKERNCGGLEPVARASDFPFRDYQIGNEVPNQFVAAADFAANREVQRSRPSLCFLYFDSVMLVD